MGVIKSVAKRTRQQRQALANQQLVDRLNLVERKAGKYEKALLEYAKESNWCTAPKSTDGQETTSVSAEWLGPGNGPSLAQNCFGPPIVVPDSGSTEVKTNEAQANE